MSPKPAKNVDKYLKQPPILLCMAREKAAEITVSRKVQTWGFFHRTYIDTPHDAVRGTKMKTPRYSNGQRYN
jgi:hypothetical protein